MTSLRVATFGAKDHPRQKILIFLHAMGVRPIGLYLLTNLPYNLRAEQGRDLNGDRFVDSNSL